jgi:hypothetical protein
MKHVLANPFFFFFWRFFFFFFHYCSQLLSTIQIDHMLPLTSDLGLRYHPVFFFFFFSSHRSGQHQL